MAKKIPEELVFTSHDEWVQQGDDDIVTVGISDFAQDALGEIVHVELPDLGAEAEVGEVAGEVESVKAVAEVYFPVSGEVVAVNDALDDEPEAINDDPYGAWFFKIKMTEPDELLVLMDAAAYQAKIDEDE